MTVRALMKRDIVKVRDIHSKFYESEFPISDLNSMTCGYCIVDEYDNIITAGGIRTIMEAVIVTDKDVEIEKRRRALIDMLTVSAQMTKSAGYPQLHAFIQDNKWERHLLKHGFKPTIGKSLVINV